MCVLYVPLAVSVPTFTYVPKRVLDSALRWDNEGKLQVSTLLGSTSYQAVSPPGTIRTGVSTPLPTSDDLWGDLSTRSPVLKFPSGVSRVLVLYLVR